MAIFKFPSSQKTSSQKYTNVYSGMYLHLSLQYSLQTAVQRQGLPVLVVIRVQEAALAGPDSSG